MLSFLNASKIPIILLCLTALTACSSSNKKIDRAPISKSAPSFDEVVKLQKNNSSADPKIAAARKELLTIAQMIYKNETGENRDNLVYWNPNEPFPSLGIGHFIWYPKGYNASYGDMLPSLIAFYQQNNRKVPKILTSRYAPWKNRSEFEAARKRGEFEELIRFFEETKDVQIVFIYKRLLDSVDKMVASSKKPDHIKKQFTRVMKTKNGLYPLIDYVNFKGEGTKPIKEYNNISWGLQQVLESMNGSNVGRTALSDFSEGCKKTLKARVNNQPSNKKDDVFLPGWLKRCDTYANAHNLI
ncbi:hypothetical protein [Thorsellia anophelis]|uniref:Lipoprotein n=1 Tax=Thorsellia anophelis DSM 18579 TaxID=1123402 RepID=A0A1I0BRZ9_9GAMM|nr:hypothetical protein [Thorsellia anophelis]SET09488.1 hypothetical protein SAMN02583745_01374 [Thorsellia anophelis DSM 18579]